MVVPHMSPVLKWAGGKTQLLDPIISKIPNEYDTYYEPFVGGGAVLLAVAPNKAVINDTNEQLINMYQQIKENHSDVVYFVQELDSVDCDKEYYYSIREKYNEKISLHMLDAECAAIMIWLNKHCFNGLYRVNGKGAFNVPYNNKVKCKSINESNVEVISKYFSDNNISIMCCDFEEVCSSVKSNDFVYFDSPYVPVSDTADFTNYTKDSFTLKDHERLARLFHRLDNLGAKVMLSNNDVPLVHEMYQGYNIHSIDVKRLINRNAAKRTGKEVIVTNY